MLLGTWLQIHCNLENMLRMRWELDGNKEGNSWEHIGNNKDPTAHPPPKDKKNMAHLVAWNHLIGCKKVFLPAHILCHFWPRLMAGA